MQRYTKKSIPQKINHTRRYKTLSRKPPPTPAATPLPPPCHSPIPSPPSKVTQCHAFSQQNNSTLKSFRIFASCFHAVKYRTAHYIQITYTMSNLSNFTPEERALLSRAQIFCDRQEQCPSSVMDKLRTWGATQDVASHIIEQLIADNYINPQRFCQLFAESKLHQQKWGRVKIAYQLRNRQLDSALIKQVLDSIDPEQYYHTLVNLAQTKWPTIHDADPVRRRTKLMAFLASHGFTQPEISRALNELNI